MEHAESRGVGTLRNLAPKDPGWSPGDVEEFELTVANDQVIELFHISSGTTYEFSGRGFIQLLRAGEKSKSTLNSDVRKRTKIIRKKKKKFNA